MDEVDLANDRAEEFTANALRVLRAQKDLRSSTGYCHSCNEKIEVERLIVNPSARHCCDCAAEDELDRKRAKRIGVM